MLTAVAINTNVNTTVKEDTVNAQAKNMLTSLLPDSLDCSVLQTLG